MGKEKRRNHTKLYERDEHEGQQDQPVRVLVNGVDVGWHKEDTFRNHLKEFHEKFARQPDRKKVNVILEILRPVLERKLSSKSFRCVRIEYTGSSFEGAKVPKGDDDPDFEFDMLFIIEGGDQLKKVADLDPDLPGFVFLEPSDRNIHEHRFEKQLVQRSDKRRLLSAAKFLSDFHSVLAECIREIGDIRKAVSEKNLHTDYLIKLRRHGPAIEMDVYLDTTSSAAVEGEILYEREQGEVGCIDGIQDDAIGDENEPRNQGETKSESGLEDETEEGRSRDPMKDRNGDADETEEADGKFGQGGLEDNGKANFQEVCFKFRLATKDVIGRKELSKLKKLYSVDVVPTLHVPSLDHNPEGEYYVAKPVKGHEDRTEELKSAWRRSFSLDAKKMLKCADNDNTCKKMVFRILKAIRNRECGLSKMNTYHLKNALLKELYDTDINRECKDWSMSSLAERFMDVLERLIAEYDPGKQMPEYFIKDIDLLEHMPETTRENIHCRLKRLRNSEKQMLRTLEDKKPRKQRPRKKRVNKKQDKGLSTGI